MEGTFKTLKVLAVLVIVLCLLFCSSATQARADSEGAATVTASALNMRSEASTSSSIVTCVPRGTIVLLTGSEGDWYRVFYQGHQGYMLSDYLSVSHTAEANLGTGTIQGTDVRVRSGPGTSYSILGEEDTGFSLDITGVSDDWLKVSYNGGAGYVKSTYMKLGDGSEPAKEADGDSGSVSGTAGSINATSVRLRSGPSTSHSILGVYDTGKAVTIKGIEGDWYQVVCDGKDGYVYKTYVTAGSGGAGNSPAGQSVKALSDTAATTISAVHLRSGPDTSYTSLGVLPAGTGVTVTGETDTWYRATHNGTSGYIYKTYVSLGGSSGNVSTGSEGARIVEEAKKYLGVSYVYGGTSPSGIDCSGFVYYVFQQCGYTVTRSAATQNGNGRQVSRSELQPGDIIIFYNSSNTAIGHSGIYIGNDQFIHASSGAGKVVITSLSTTHYDGRYFSARRIVG